MQKICGQHVFEYFIICSVKRNAMYITYVNIACVHEYVMNMNRFKLIESLSLNYKCWFRN